MSANYTDEFNDLTTAFNAQWDNRCPVSWPNVSFAPPVPAAPWCRFTILNAPASRMTIGSPGLNRAVYPGRIVIQVFAPRGHGEPVARQLADEAAGIFRTLKLSGYRFYLPYITQVASGVTGDWYQVNMDAPFQWDSYHG